MSHDQHVLEASTSRCKMQLEVRKTSTSNHMMARKSTASVLEEGVLCWRRKAEIKQLEQRLRVLEEEADMLKGDLLESVEESKRLITEIHQYFNTIQDCLLQREVDRGESYTQRDSDHFASEGKKSGSIAGSMPRIKSIHCQQGFKNYSFRIS